MQGPRKQCKHRQNLLEYLRDNLRMVIEYQSDADLKKYDVRFMLDDPRNEHVQMVHRLSFTEALHVIVHGHEMTLRDLLCEHTVADAHYVYMTRK